MANQNLLVQISIPTVDMTLEMAEPRYAQKKAAEEKKSSNPRDITSVIIRTYQKYHIYA